MTIKKSDKQISINDEPIDLPGVFPWIKSETRMLKNTDADDFADATGKAHAVVQGAVDGFIRLMQHDHPRADRGLICLALQTALMSHAAKIALFANHVGKAEFTSESFAELASEVFEELSEQGQGE